MPTNFRALEPAYLGSFYAENPDWTTSVKQWPVARKWFGYPGASGVKIWREQRIVLGELAIDTAERRVTLGDEPVHLTPIEFDLLLHLAGQPRAVLARDALLAQVWGWSHAGGSRTVDSHIKALRRKLGANLIRTELCREAIRLGRLLVELMPDRAEANALLALMLLHDARREARTTPDGASTRSWSATSAPITATSPITSGGEVG